MMTVSINFKRDLVDNFQNKLSDLGEMGARKLVSSTLNRTAHSAFVATKHELVNRTGIAYSAIGNAVTERKSSPESLTYRIHATGRPTNLREFRPYDGARAFLASPWNVRRAFPRTFLVGGSGPLAGLVFHRGPDGGREIDPSFGPNLATEMGSKEVVAVFQNAMRAKFMPEIARRLKLDLNMTGPLSVVATAEASDSDN